MLYKKTTNNGDITSQLLSTLFSVISFSCLFSFCKVKSSVNDIPNTKQLFHSVVVVVLVFVWDMKDGKQIEGQQGLLVRKLRGPLLLSLKAAIGFGLYPKRDIDGEEVIHHADCHYKS